MQEPTVIAVTNTLEADCLVGRIGGVKMISGWITSVHPKVVRHDGKLLSIVVVGVLPEYQL
jgi:hypothetical protein